MLSFRLFDMEADPTCRYDYLDIYNGHSYLVQKLGRFCGTFRPGAIISTSNTMMLEMVSDASTGGRGFLAYFSAGKPHVEGKDTDVHTNMYIVKQIFSAVTLTVSSCSSTPCREPVLRRKADQRAGLGQDPKLAQL